MSTEEPTDLMTIRSRDRGKFVVRNPEQMSVRIKEFNENLYMVRSILKLIHYLEPEC